MRFFGRGASRTLAVLFDSGFYASQMKGARPRDLIGHYIAEGWKQGLKPHPLFWPDWYLKTYPDIAAAGTEPFGHYLKHGGFESRDPSPVFSSSLYLALYPDVAGAKVNPLLHYAQNGGFEGRKPHLMFDPTWYVGRSGYEASSGVPALAHYLLYGESEGREPHPLFDPVWYRRTYAGALNGETAFAHFLQQGEGQVFDPNPLFWSGWYATHYALPADEIAALHYLRVGAAQGHWPNPLFDPEHYGRQTGGPLPGTDLLSHFIHYGAAGALDPHERFSTGLYMARNRAARRAKANPLAHFIRFGDIEHISPHPSLDDDFAARRTDADAQRGLDHVRMVAGDRLGEDADDHRPAVQLPSEMAAPYFLLGRHPRVTPAGWAFFRNAFDEETGATIAELWDFLEATRSLPTDHDWRGDDRITGLLNRIRAALAQRPDVATPDASIVVPVHGHAAYTLACLYALATHKSAATFEIIVADDASPDWTADAIGTLQPFLRLERNEKNLGFLKTCNHAATFARAPYLVLLNNDTIVLPGWLDGLLDTFKVWPDAAVSGSMLLFADGTLQEAGGIVWREGNAWNYGRGADPELPQFNFAREADYCSAASVAIPRDVWRDLRGFDEAYAPAYCEDSDFSFRARAVGRPTIYQPASKVIHHEGVSHGRDETRGLKQYQVTNGARLREVHAEALAGQFSDGQSLFLARDRSVGRKHVLVVDHYVPRPDRDAGSRTIFQYVEGLVRLGCRVTFWADNLFRDPGYAEALQRLGVEVMYGPQLSGRFDEWMEAFGAQIDFALLSRPHVAQKYLPALRRYSKARVAYYGHDVHHERLLLEYGQDGEAATLKLANGIKAIEARLWRDVDLTLYPTQREIDQVLEAVPEAKAEAIAGFAYSAEELEAGGATRPEGRSGLLFVGGFGHAPNADAVRWFAGEVMPLVLAKRPSTVLRIAGSNPPEDLRALAGGHIELLGFVSDEELAAQYQAARAVIAPLRFGSGIKGKVIEAFKFGVPIVTTPVGAQGIPEAETLLSVAEEPAAFAAAIEALLADDRRWMSFARRGWDFVSGAYGEDGLKAQFSRILQGGG